MNQAHELLNAMLDKPQWRSGMNELATNDDLMNKISGVSFCWLRLIAQGHMTVICAKGNGGKTTVMIKAAADMAGTGYEVYYINVDASADAIKEYDLHSSTHRYILIAPDLHIGKSVDDVTAILKRMTEADEDLSSVVLILDTLKKFAELMNKSQAKKFYSLLRNLTAKGVTVIALAHTNKYDDKDGKPIFEGTADLRNDFDELIYFIPLKNLDGSITVSTDIDKSRGVGFQNYTFEIGIDRAVTVKDEFVDTAAALRLQESKEKDLEVIEFVQECIRYQSRSVQDIQKEAEAQGKGFSQRRIRNVVVRYTSGICPEPLWVSIKNHRNGFQYGQMTDEYREEIKKNSAHSKTAKSAKFNLGGDDVESF